MSPMQALSLVRRGEHIHLSDGSATPLGIVPHLVADELPIGDNEIVHLLTLGDAPYVRPEFATKFRHNALFIGANVREAVADGRADYTPVFLSEIPRLVRERRIPIDVTILSMTPPDVYGYCTLGTHVGIARAAIEVARCVIGQINPRMPRTFGDTLVHVDQVHAFVECEHELPELKPPPPRSETDAIARYIAELVPDGAMLQMGIGGIPDAVLQHLANHNDLGVHTEMFSDGVIELARRGVINGRRNRRHPGKIVSSFTMGSRQLYDFVDNNPMIELYAVDYVNDPFVVAQHDDMIAINTALEVDLTGQVCSDSIGTSFYSGIGGQVDFIRGAARARRGKPIIALPSTARDGTVSRIVPRLDDGAGVVTTRGDVHYVVTEWGIADLHGRNVRERAMALISVAHPKFRPWLLAEAKQRKYVHVDQLEPPFRTPIYPKQFEATARTKDGMTVLLRPIKPTDEERLHDMFYRFSQETIYQRFFAIKNFLPQRSLQQFCTIDYDQDMTLVASLRQGEVETIIGMSMFALDPKSGWAEAACVVADEYHGRGVGTLLLRQLTTIALGRGVRGFTAVVLGSNAAMIHCFGKCGFPIQKSLNGDTVAIRIPFQRPEAAVSAAISPPVEVAVR
ncbi:MAG: GNAT family N-acetyltransferase [Phycisphaerae bacterium]